MMDPRSFAQHFEEDYAQHIPDAPQTSVTLDSADLDRAAIALVEIRGWAVAAPPDASRYVTDRVDACLDVLAPESMADIRRATDVAVHVVAEVLKKRKDAS
jgi:hypothetical protein